jgi:hypothetical protein
MHRGVRFVPACCSTAWVQTYLVRRTVALDSPRKRAKSVLIAAHPGISDSTLPLVPRNSGIKGLGSNDRPKRETARLQALRVDGARRIRTADLLGAIQALCQLSYSPEMADQMGDCLGRPIGTRWSLARARTRCRAARRAALPVPIWSGPSAARPGLRPSAAVGSSGPCRCRRRSR